MLACRMTALQPSQAATHQQHGVICGQVGQRHTLLDRHVHHLAHLQVAGKQKGAID